MIEVSEKKFRQLVAEAIDHIPAKYFDKIKNLGFVVEDEPTPAQREQLKLECNQTLFGLYEGIPLTKRGAGYNLVLPDKITIFRLPMLAAVDNLDQLKSQIRHTVWHEVAHYFGLDHDRIHALERR